MASRAARTGKGLAGLAAILAAVLVAGCAAPRYTYIADSGTTDQTYFKVPGGWHKVSDSSLAAALNGGKAPSGPSGIWSVGYDGASAPSARHVLSSSTAQPFVFAMVGKLNSTAQSNMSYNSLRDFFLPVTQAARQGAAQQGFPLTRFHLLRDATLDPGHGVHGVRVTFQYTYPDGTTDTFDQVAFTNSDSSKVYVLFMHCLSSCYQHDRGEINTVMTSFTVRSS
ncbi:MAG: hypothetical protein J2P35_08775 [Actinobacteria bacterium]|nr:hypothetical protein [Actinomycetota bacterium]MBO0786435.1 hypothetical protein [Actinomycetota bacterium]MBO0818275.1 hypothetical protein [Actinomycetota bacterium]